MVVVDWCLARELAGMQPKGRPGRGVWDAVPASAASAACLTSVTKPWTAVRSQSGRRAAEGSGV
jgi:uncharacterized protein YbdZ (MbtH family)